MKTVTRKALRWRLFRSVGLGLVFSILMIIGFKTVMHSPEVDGTPAPLRKVLTWNEKIWHSFFSEKRLSVKRKAPLAGKSPRFNGDLGLMSAVDLNHYQVHVESGDKKIDLPMSALLMLPKLGYSTDFKCVEGWSEVIQYAGARFSDFMNRYDVGKKPDGSYYRYVGLETPDSEYYVSIDIDSMVHPQTLLAYEMNEAPISMENGAPIRLIIPIKYGIKSIKRIGKIVFSDQRPPDYWAEQGYDWWAGL